MKAWHFFETVSGFITNQCRASCALIVFHLSTENTFWCICCVLFIWCSNSCWCILGVQRSDWHCGSPLV